MRNVAKLLAKLYPSAWRERYGDEFETLLEDKTLGAGDLLDVFWEGLKMQIMSPGTIVVVSACALAGLLFGVIASLRIPREYVSSTMVVVSTDPSEAGSSVDQAAHGKATEGHIAALVDQAFSNRDAMAAIVSKYDLYPQERAKVSMDEAIRQMRMATRVVLASPSAVDKEIDRLKARVPWVAPEAFESSKKNIRSAFTVQFQYPDPRKAQRVDAELLDLITRASLAMAENHEGFGPDPMFNIMDAPNLPDKPVGPGLTVRALIGMLYGFLCGVLLAMAMNAMRGRRAEGA